MKKIILIITMAIIVFNGSLNAEKFLGNIWKNEWTSQGAVSSDFNQLFNQITPENTGKWGDVERTQGNFNWAIIDEMFQYANIHGFQVKEHNFLWGLNEPDWISGLDAIGQQNAVINWITSYMNRYSNQVEFIDVVNEPIHAPLSFKDALGGDGVTGWDWVIWAFERAREIAPNAKLLINEFGVLNNSATKDTYLAIINLLNDRGLLDGIGVQAHWLEGTRTSTISAHLNELAAVGLPVYVSELDICDSNDSVQLAKYQSIFPVLWEHPSVEGVTFWGYQQDQIWRDDAYLVRNDGSWRPALNWLVDDYFGGSGNLALNAPYSTSSERSGFEGSRAIDGDGTTKWWADASDLDAPYINVYIGNEIIDGVYLRDDTIGAALGGQISSYAIQYLQSGVPGWQTQAFYNESITNSGVNKSFSPIFNVRNVRISFFNRGFGHPVGLTDFEVYNTGGINVAANRSGGVISFSSDKPGFEAENAFDLNSGTKWSAADNDVDAPFVNVFVGNPSKTVTSVYLMDTNISGINMGQMSSFVVQALQEGVPGWQSIIFVNGDINNYGRIEVLPALSNVTNVRISMISKGFGVAPGLADFRVYGN